MIYLIVITSYVVGNFLPAVYIGNRTGQSIRTVGSGNPGARNAGRVFGKKTFLFVLLVDAGKGALVVYVAYLIDGRPAVELLALLAVMIGHCYPIFHRFQGGKGAATWIGGFLAFNASFFVPIVLCFLILYVIMRKGTAASVLATLAVIPSSLWLYDAYIAFLAFIVVLLLLWRHQTALIPQKEGST